MNRINAARAGSGMAPIIASDRAQLRGQLFNPELDGKKPNNVRCFLCPDASQNMKRMWRGGEEPDDLHIPDSRFCGPFFEAKAFDQWVLRTNAGQKTSKPAKMWVHRDCMLWSHETLTFDESHCNIGGHIVRTVSGLSNLDARRCGVCNQPRPGTNCARETRPRGKCTVFCHYRCIRRKKAADRGLVSDNFYFFCKSHKAYLSTHASQYYKDTWEPPADCEPRSVFPKQIFKVATEASRQDRTAPFIDFTGITDFERNYSNWTEEHHERFKKYMKEPANIKRALDADARAIGASVKASAIRHPEVGVGLFCNDVMKPKGSEVGFFFGKIIYRDIQKYVELGYPPDFQYGDDFISCDSRDFLRLGLEVRLSSMASWKLKRSSVWIIPAAFCAIGRVNDYQYIQGDADIHLEGTANQRKPSIDFYVKRPYNTVQSVADLLEHNLFVGRVTRQIDPGQEIYADYFGAFIDVEEEDNADD